MLKRNKVKNKVSCFRCRDLSLKVFIGFVLILIAWEVTSANSFLNSRSWTRSVRKLERSTEKLIKKSGLFETPKLHHAGKSTKKKGVKKKVPKLPRKGKTNKQSSWRRQASRKIKKIKKQELQDPVTREKVTVVTVKKKLSLPEVTRESPILEVKPPKIEESVQLKKVSKVTTVQTKALKEVLPVESDAKEAEEQTVNSGDAYIRDYYTTPMSTVQLDAHITRRSMVDYSLHKTYNWKNSIVADNCVPTGSCPHFGRCDSSRVASIAQCHNAPYSDRKTKGKPPLNLDPKSKQDVSVMPEFEGNVFILENVYLSSKGFVFNSSHFFLRGGCTFLDDLDFLPSTTVTKFKALVALVNWNAAFNFFHALCEGVPEFLMVESILKKYPDIPLAIRKGQDKGLQKKLLPYVGMNMEDMNLQVMQSDHELFWAEKLIVPVAQNCGKPSGSVVERVRKKHLKLPSMPKMANNLSLAERARMWSDWRIVFGRRDAGQKRQLLQQDEIQLALESRYGRNRVQPFWGNLSIDATLALFRHSVLYVGPHGAGMTNLYFMPAHSAVLEIRPDQWDNACYHYLADRCKVDYYMLRAHGNFTSPLDANVTQVMELVDTLLPQRKTASF